MESYTKLEIAVGAFVVAGLLALGYVSISLGGLKPFSNDHYEISARFASVGGLKLGAPVRIAGVNVGEVEAIRLKDYAADVVLSVERNVKLPEDTIASIQSSGLLGDAHVSLSPGGAAKDLSPGGRIVRTEPAISLTELIAKYAFGAPLSDDKPSPKPDNQADDSSNDDATGGGANEKDSPFADPLE